MSRIEEPPQEQPDALNVASWACQHARRYCSTTIEAALARNRLFEVFEVQGRFEDAEQGFHGLVEDLPVRPGPFADLGCNCSNHFISLGIKTRTPVLAKYGLLRSHILEALVSNQDERSSVLQWYGLFEAQQGDLEAAHSALEESFRLRAKTERRRITRFLPEGHLALAEGRVFDGLELLDAGIAEAESAELVRHADAGRRIRQRLFVAGEVFGPR